MTSLKCFLHGAFAALVCAPLVLACTDDGGAESTTTETDSGDGDGDDTTGDGDGDSDDTTGDGDGDGDSGDGDGDKPELGATPNVLCEVAVTNLDVISAENQSGNPDVMTIEAAYLDTGLQDFVQLAGAVTGRIEAGVLLDDAAILAALADGSPEAMIDVEWTIYLAMHQYLRHEIADVAATLPDPANDPALLYARWDAAYCYWDGGLRPLAQAADAIGLAGDSIEADIDGGFAWGHSGIEGEVAWAIDEWTLGPAKQVVEKSTFAMVHRLVLSWSALAQVGADALAAREAYGAFQLLEDRMAGKNTPGIAIIEDALTGDPGSIDADDVLLQMNITFAKRTRAYTDHALPEVNGLMGTAEGYAGANEGATYSKLVEPFMAELDGFDAASYRATWEAWIDAVEVDDVAAGAAAAAELTDWNCQFQASLGIAECSSSIDELP